MMVLDGNERRRITPDKSPTQSVVLRPSRHFNIRDNSPVNRHSYHGMTSPLTSPTSMQRLGQMKRYSQQLQYSPPYADPFSGNHIHCLGKQCFFNPQIFHSAHKNDPWCRNPYRTLIVYYFSSYVARCCIFPNPLGFLALFS
ncbi:hypothetical protein NECAME_01279 [Necator americanus]|uniref:Uncharacterized protein n=1 Tax=Necator americanus TaxID=51031 RepID=W2TYH2_NECAM|nr:hypothetical protein NECAME_01279 [Necator americanus]ETN87120.1 hypothetical protein NECAME_01279 [Necator americanus]